jgi:surfeit locus 1 family protein
MSPSTRRIAIVGLMVVAAVFVRLGFWQVERLSERRVENRAAQAARDRPAVRLGTTGAAGNLGDRWVEARGAYDRAHEVVLRGQAYQGAPGLHVLTPLRLEGSDSAVLVLRGFVPSADGVRADLDSLNEPGTVQVRGLATPAGSGPGQPVDHAGRTTWARIDLPALRERVPYPLLPIVLRQSPDSALPRSPRRLAPPELNDGPHLNYAIQWFLFAAMTVGFAVLVVGRTGREQPMSREKPMSS